MFVRDSFPSRIEIRINRTKSTTELKISFVETDVKSQISKKRSHKFDYAIAQFTKIDSDQKKWEKTLPTLGLSNLSNQPNYFI